MAQRTHGYSRYWRICAEYVAVHLFTPPSLGLLGSWGNSSFQPCITKMRPSRLDHLPNRPGRLFDTLRSSSHRSCPVAKMRHTSVTSMLILLMFGVQSASTTSLDPQEWYTTHPGLARTSRVDQETHQIVDEHGRTRFFHGTNVVMKEPLHLVGETSKPYMIWV